MNQKHDNQVSISGVITGKLGDICSFRSTTARKGDIVYSAPDIAALHRSSRARGIQDAITIIRERLDDSRSGTKEFGALSDCLEALRNRLEEANKIDTSQVESVAPSEVSVAVERWEYRSHDITVRDPDVREWTEWRPLIPRGLQTIDDAVAEMREYIERGYHYELRSLVVAEVFGAQSEAG